MNRPNQNPEQSSRRELIERLIFFAAVAFLLFIGGLMVARLGWFPYPIVDDAVTAARAEAIRQGWINEEEAGATLVDGERADTLAGVSFHDASLSAGGYTVYTSEIEEAAVMVDIAGNTVHRWSLSEDKMREHFGAERVPDARRYGWRSFHLYPNGDFLAVVTRSKWTPYGFALVKVDKDSNVLWGNFGYAHHDVTVGEDGLIYAIGQEIREDRIPDFDYLKPPILNDFVLVVSDDGKTLHRISIIEAFVGTPFAKAFKQLVKGRDWKGDFLHVNAIEPYDSRNRIPILRENEVLISIRNMDALATLNLGTGKITGLIIGSWRAQHDPDIVNGHIVLFDNRGDFARGSRSRVIEFDPVTQQITWQARTGNGFDLYSGWGANQQVLDNGNVLVTEAAPGRVVELTRDGRAAWVFNSPGRSPVNPMRAPSLLEAKRYAPESLSFEFNGQSKPQETP